MNYFAALLLTAGLPTSMALPSVLIPTSAPSLSAASWAPATGIATISGAFHTMQTARPFYSTGSVGSTNPSTTVSSNGATHSSSPQPTQSGSDTMGGGASTMITLINQARRQAGLAPYTVSAPLMTLAQERAQALAAGPFTSDMTPYGWPAQMEQKAGITAQGLGAENIAEASSVQEAFAMLMASPPHRENILNPYETQIGVGVAPWGSGVAISELFIGPNP